MGVVSSVMGLRGEGEAGLEGLGGGAAAAPPPPPWLFSERDVRDLRRLKNPLFLDSRFFSTTSWRPGGGALTPGSLQAEEEEYIDCGFTVFF